MTEEYDLLLLRLLENPEQFESRGEGNALLKEHFKGAPVELLRPLLASSNVFVRGTAMFVANELGVRASNLIDEILPLIRDSDVHIQWDAIESVMVCSIGEHVDKFIFVLRELQNCNSSICRLAMRLVSNASGEQTEAGIRLVDTLHPYQAAHKQGLSVLAKSPGVGRVEVIELLASADDLVKKYGAIVARRWMNQQPELIQHALRSENEVVSRFARESIN